MFPVNEVSNAWLGRLRAASEADIQRQIATASRTPQQQQAHDRTMRTLEQRATRYVEAQRQERQPPARAVAPQEAARGRSPGAARNNSVAQGRYDQATAKTPSHMEIRRSINTHIQRNMQREARRERIREVGQQVKQKALVAAKSLGRAALGRSPSQPEKQPPARQQAMQTERSTLQRTQALAVHREKVPSKSIEQPIRQPPARQQQQERGKEQSRGRSR